MDVDGFLEWQRAYVERMSQGDMEGVSDELSEIRSRFEYHPPRSMEEIQFYEEYRKKAFGLASMLVLHTGPSRERSLALTKLEDAVMAANKAIAVNGLRGGFEGG